MGKKGAKPKPTADGERTLVRNRRVTHDYQIHETVEAGVVLVGSEVKSLRDGKASIAEGHVVFRNREAWLVGVTIKEYPWANQFNHEPERDRKLLLHRREIARLHDRCQLRGYTVVPVRMYLSKGRIKVELALASGKRQFEKRDSARAADAKREIDRVMKSARNRR
jgi:SsrA-binding protein